MPRSTLIRSPAVDPSKSPIENVLELTELYDFGPDIFTNTRELWHPPGARGIYGGAVIAQALAAAQRTIPPPSPANGNAIFLIHSMHCYFVLAGDSTIPILYHVERVREGKSFMTRTVQARQRGKCIFTTTCSFMREGSGGAKVVEHEWRLPEDAVEMLEARLKDKTPLEGAGPFAMVRLGIINRGFQTFDIGEGQSDSFSNTAFAPLESSPDPHMKSTRQWTRAYGTISASGGQQAHLSALAYMSDNWFIGTVSRVHGLLRSSPNPASPSPPSSSPLSTVKPTGPIRLEEGNLSQVGTVGASSNRAVTLPPKTKPTVGMMVSLDHSIYFHRPREVVADDWLLAENQSPWTGEGRGLVTQRIWGRGGTLLATCVQEGLVRLKQVDHSQHASRPASKL